MKDKLSPRGEGIAYVIVGGVNTLFGYGVYALALFLGANYIIAALLSQIIGAVFNFFTYGFFVFRLRPRTRSLVSYLFSYAVLYGVSIVSLTLFQYLGLNAYLAGIANLLVMPVLAYLSNKFLVFKSPKDVEP